MRYNVFVQETISLHYSILLLSRPESPLKINKEFKSMKKNK